MQCTPFSQFLQTESLSKHHTAEGPRPVASIQKLIPEVPKSISQLIQSCSDFPAMIHRVLLPFCDCCCPQIWQPWLDPAKILLVFPLQSITSTDACVCLDRSGLSQGEPLHRGGASLEGLEIMFSWSQENQEGNGHYHQYVSWKFLFFSFLSFFQRMHLILPAMETKPTICLAEFWFCASFP